MGFRQDIAERHPVDSEITFSVPGAPGVPGILGFTVIESDPIRRQLATFTTKDGKVHSAGRRTQSGSMVLTVYEAEQEVVVGVEAWYEACLAGTPGHKVDVSATKFFAAGDPGAVFELEGAIVTAFEYSGAGREEASTVKFTLEYDDAHKIAI